MAKKKQYDGLPPFQEEGTYQEKINESKSTMIGLDTADVARVFVKTRNEKKALEAEISALNVVLEACSQLLVAQLEGQDVQKLTLTTGETVFLQSEPYPSVESKDQLRTWVLEQNMEEILSVHYQTLVGMVKDRLSNGEEPPPGVSVFLKTKARCRGGSAAEN